jgi:hypothetical protein
MNSRVWFLNDFMYGPIREPILKISIPKSELEFDLQLDLNFNSDSKLE